MIIGLTGTNASGKGEVVAYLRDQGYKAYSLSDVVREEALRAGRGVDRENLIVTGNRLRREQGMGVLARRLLSRLSRRAVVDSIRHPEEVRVLRERPDFRLVGVEAPLALRFARALRRGRRGDPHEIEAFRAMEGREQGCEPAGQDLAATFALCDRRVDNVGSLEDLHDAVDALLEVFGREGLEV